MKERVFNFLNIEWLGMLPLAALTFLFVLPIIWMITTSFQPSDKMYQLTIEWIPSVWHPENYPNALTRWPFPLYFLNSAIISVSVMLGNLIFCTLAGYGLAKYRFRGDKILLIIILSTLMLPMEVTLVPTFLLIHKLGWLNSYKGIVGPILIDAFGVFLIRQFIIRIPSEYIEAARIDGAGELKILWRIILPQCKPAIATLAIFAFRDSWDQFIWPLVAVSVDEYRTFPLGLVRFSEDFAAPPNEQMAIAVLATIPVVLVFWILQRSLRTGFTLTGLKG
jgi:ABC-type glycerol-3-phosphate transport system permease component